MANKCPPLGAVVNSPTDSGTCIFDCSKVDKGWEVQVRNGVPACVYTAQPGVYFSLPTFPALDAKELDLWMGNRLPREVGQQLMGQLQSAGKETIKRFELAKGKISTKEQIADAFKDLQLAENVRDKSPDAYQDARIRYYTLAKGEDWVNEEKERIIKSEVAPKVASYMTSYQDLTTRQNQQQRTMDVVKAVKDKVISMKDDFKMTTNVFGKQIAELKSQIEIEKRKGAEEKEEIQGWIHYLVNTLMVVFAIAAIVTIVRKLVSKNPTSTYTQNPTNP
jgi:hypothetical protein